MSFHPPLWAWLLTLPMLALLCGLGTWQIRRGLEKAGLQQDYAAAQTLPPAAARAAPPAPQASPLRLRAEGSYVDDRSLLLDNQTHGQTPGRRVWTPLRLDDGTLMLVDRGWVPLNASPSVAESPAPPGGLAVIGLWRRLPEPGLRLEGKSTCAPAPRFPVLVNYPTAAEVGCLLGEPVSDGLLLLDPDAPGGFVREWHGALSEIPPSRHYGYAAQWFLLAATLLFLFVRFNLKRT